MALNMTEADAVTNLLRFIAAGEISADQAYDCAGTLLAAVEKRLMMRPAIDTSQLRAGLDRLEERSSHAGSTGR